MYKMMFTTLFSARWMVLVLLALAAVNVQAAALFTLKGTTDQAKYADDAQVHISVLGWSDPDSLKAVEGGYVAYQSAKDAEVFGKLLQDQPTLGFVFTAAATGYTVKYAWQESTAAGQRMLLLVSPALKTRNPYMWKTPNTQSLPFSLLEIREADGLFTVYSSVDQAITANPSGRLQLADTSDSVAFATLRDATPYYLQRTNAPQKVCPDQGAADKTRTAPYNSESGCTAVVLVAQSGLRW